MDNEEKDKLEIGYWRLIFGVVGGISALFGIYTFVSSFKGFYLIISILGIIIIILVALCINLHSKYKAVVKNVKKIQKELDHADDNRSTLQEIVKRNNEEIELLKDNIRKSNAQKALLFTLYRDGKNITDRKLINAFEIDYDGVIKHEEV